MRLQSTRFSPLFFAVLVAAAAGFSLQDPSSCASGSYFNTTLLKCTTCELANTQAAADNTSCECKPGYKAVYDDSTRKLTGCTACGTGYYTFGPDPTKCYTGSSSVTANTNGQAACSADNYIQYITSSGTLNCRECPLGEYAVAGVTSGSCVKCPHPRQQYVLVSGTYKCTCQNDADYEDAGTTCVLRTKYSSVPTDSSDYYISYRQIEKPGGSSLSSAKVLSPFFQTYYKEAYSSCVFDLNATGCEFLANMCVLSMYAVDTAMCKTILSIQSSLPAVSGESYSEYVPLCYSI